MELKEKYSKWMYIFFPAITMMLGWGLRGHIGGGPMGAMIPGAMVALTICMLLELPAVLSSLIVVFGVVGIGMGGEMTYGQTLGFLRNPDTVWWGIVATTVKGGVWGLLGGVILSMGFIINKLSKRKIIYAMLLMMAGMILGFKLINEPMLIYFSDRAKPRSESWAALLFGAIALLVYLKIKTEKNEFSITAAFAKWGLIGGGLGFGLGGLWMVMGSNMPDGIIFGAWWKSMEFTFGWLLGGALGWAAYLNRAKLKALAGEERNSDRLTKQEAVKYLLITFVLGVMVFWGNSFVLNPLERVLEGSSNSILQIVYAVLNILENYSFYGLMMIMVALYYPKAAWLIGISLTFCHTMIDLGRDHIVKVVTTAPEVVSVVSIILSTLVVSLLVIKYQGKQYVKRAMLMILTWSTVFVSTFKIIFYPQKMNPEGSLGQLIFGLFVVDIAFLIMALVVTWITFRKVEAA